MSAAPVAAADIEERVAGAVVEEQLVRLHADGSAGSLLQVPGAHVEILPSVEVEVVEPAAPGDGRVVGLLHRALDAGLHVFDETTLPSLRMSLFPPMLDSAMSQSLSRSTSADGNAHRVHEQRRAGLERHVGERPSGR